MESLPDQDEALYEAMIARRLPDLNPKWLEPFAPTAEAEISRLKALRPGDRDPVTRHRVLRALSLPKSGDLTTRVEHPPALGREHLELVMSEAWVSHWLAFCARERPGYAPFRGAIDAYIERRVVEAARAIHGFLTFGVPVWRPKMWHPLSGVCTGPSIVWSIFASRLEAAVARAATTNTPLLTCTICTIAASAMRSLPTWRSSAALVTNGSHPGPCGYPQDASWRDRNAVAGLSKIFSADTSHIRPTGKSWPLLGR